MWHLMKHAMRLLLAAAGGPVEQHREQVTISLPSTGRSSKQQAHCMHHEMSQTPNDPGRICPV